MSMATPVLMILTALRWVGAARMPRALAQAGFEVTLLAPTGSLAEKSAYVAKVAYLPEKGTPETWVHAVAATAKGMGARLVVPCDDNAFRLLQMLAKSPPEGLQPAVHQELATLITASLGDPAHYASSVDASALAAAVAALGIGVPAAGDVDDHVHSPGQVRSYQAAAWKGDLLVGFAGERVLDPSGGGAQTGVNRYYRSDALRRIAAATARGFGISGLFSMEGVFGEGGRFQILELNRRLLGGAHRGREFGVDHCAALYAALHGLPPPGRVDLDEGEEQICVCFPQEWLRDPESKWLRDYPVDVPWEEPELFEAMLDLYPTR